MGIRTIKKSDRLVWCYLPAAGGVAFESAVVSMTETKTQVVKGVMKQKFKNLGEAYIWPLCKYLGVPRLHEGKNYWRRRYNFPNKRS